MNIFKLTHTFSPAIMNKIISSEISRIDLWNIIYLLQCTFSEIDSSHLPGEANIATLLIKFFDAMVYDPNFHYDTNQLIEIDLHENWEIGLVDDKDNVLIYECQNYVDLLETYKLKYNFYKQNMYSYFLELIIRENRLFNGDAACDESFGMNNSTWMVLFNEGIYNVDNLKNLLKTDSAL